MTRRGAARAGLFATPPRHGVIPSIDLSWRFGCVIPCGFFELKEFVDNASETSSGSGVQLLERPSHDPRLPTCGFGFVVAEEVSGGDVEELCESAQGGGFGIDSWRSQEVADAFGRDAMSSGGELAGDFGLGVGRPAIAGGSKKFPEPGLDQPGGDVLDLVGRHVTHNTFPTAVGTRELWLTQVVVRA